MEFVSDVQTYQNLLAEPSLWQEMAENVTLPDVFWNELVRFSSLRLVACLPCKIFALKRLFHRTMQALGLPKVKVKFHPFRAGHTYMLDRGEVHFCKQFLFFDPYEKNVAMALHELAHVYLSKQEGYGRLLALDGEFINCLKAPSQTVIAPVEFYANVLANAWLAEVAERLPQEKRAVALQQERVFVQEKLAKAIDEL